MNRKATQSQSPKPPQSRLDGATGGTKGLLLLSAGFAAAAIAAGYFAVLDPEAATSAALRDPVGAGWAGALGATRGGPGTSTDETGMADEMDVVPALSALLDHGDETAPAATGTPLGAGAGVGAVGAAAAVDDAPATDELDVREHVLKPGETVAGALEDEGLTRSAAAEVVDAMTPKFDFRLARDGDKFTVETGPDGRVAGFEYARSPIDVWVATRDAGGRLDVHKKSIETTTERALIGASINKSLYATIERAGESTSLVAYFTDVFAWDLDFYVDTQAGDTIRVVVEKIFHEGRFLKYGRILAAEYAGKKGTFRAFWYDDPATGKGDYYDDEGRSLRKAFLKTPLKFVRITSKFTPKRMHPVLHTITSHMGVDYAAPTGTPIRSVAEGIVTWAGWKGPNGNLVVVKHKNDYVSAYAHLSRIPTDIKAGARVDHRRIIGYVGSTGYSTGPHLHFALRHAGAFINPLTMKMLPGDPLPPLTRKAYGGYVASRRMELEHITLLHLHVTAPSAGPAIDL